MSTGVRDALVETRAEGHAVPRLSFGSWAFAFGPYERAPWDFERICRYVADAGYQGIEINGFRPHPHDQDDRSARDWEDLRTVLQKGNLAVSAYAPDFRDAPPAEVELDVYLARIDSTLAFCRQLSIPMLRTDTVTAPGPVDGDRWQRLVTAWQVAANRCADQGVRLVWEFEPGFWINRPSDVRRLADEVGHPNFKVLFDTSHAYTGAVAGARQGIDPELLPGGVAEYAALLGEHVGHLHLIDSDGSLHGDETSAHLAFGEGQVLFPEVLAALPGHGLDLDWWTVDFCFNSTTERDGRLALPFVQGLRDRAAASLEEEGE